MTISEGTSAPMVIGGDGMGFGGGGFIWAFLIFALLMGGNGMFGGWGNGGNGNANAIQNDINRGFDSQNTMANQREILSAVNDASARGIAATNQSFHDMLAYNGDKYNEITRDIGAIAVSQANALANQNQCCCETKQLIQSVGAQTNANIAQNRYEAAMNTAAVNANTTAQTQKILDAMAQNKIESLQSRVNQLETQNLLGNVVRYPTAMAYSAGPSPFCGCGNGFGGYPVYA